MRRKGTVHLNTHVSPDLKKESIIETEEETKREASPAWHKRSKTHFMKKVNDSYGHFKGDNIDR